MNLFFLVILTLFRYHSFCLSFVFMNVYILCKCPLQSRGQLAILFDMFLIWISSAVSIYAQLIISNYIYTY